MMCGVAGAFISGKRRCGRYFAICTVKTGALISTHKIDGVFDLLISRLVIHKAGMLQGFRLAIKKLLKQRIHRQLTLYRRKRMCIFFKAIGRDQRCKQTFFGFRDFSEEHFFAL
jgi:hypothetical protein